MESVGCQESQYAAPGTWFDCSVRSVGVGVTGGSLRPNAPRCVVAAPPGAEPAVASSCAAGSGFGYARSKHLIRFGTLGCSAAERLDCPASKSTTRYAV